MAPSERSALAHPAHPADTGAVERPPHRTSADDGPVSVIRALPDGGSEIVERRWSSLSRLAASDLSAEHARLAGAARPILLVGGVASFPRDFRNWAVRLAFDGFDPYAIDLPGKGFAPLANDVDVTLRAIEGLRLRTGFERIHLVGHSKGGVSVLAAADVDPAQVASVTTIASPHSGVGTTGMGRAARRARDVLPSWMRDLARDSEALARRDGHTYRGPITNLHSSVFDGLITPRSAQLERDGVEHVIVPFRGGNEVHAALPRTNATVFAIARRAIIDVERALDIGELTGSVVDVQLDAG